MGTTHVNVLLRDHFCTPIVDCWMLDLVVNLCNGTPLYEVFPIVDQLKKRYATPASVEDFTEYPLSTDQAGLTLEINSQVLSFASPAMTQVEIYTQIKNFFTNLDIKLEGGQIKIATKDRGPDATLTIGGTCDLKFGPITHGAGYKISTRYYHGAYRINILPPKGDHINHVELDMPAGCYKIWGRACHGRNEETSVAMVILEDCGECTTVNLMLPEVMNCARDAIYPVMEKIAVEYAQVFPEQADKVVIMKGVAQVANLGREQILAELAMRKQDAIDLDRDDLEARVDAVIAIAYDLPQCC
jgi:hypothetical protein